MIKEISRSSWAKFCKKFSTENRYRLFNVDVTKRDHSNGKIVWEWECLVLCYGENRPDDLLTEPMVELHKPLFIRQKGQKWERLRNNARR